MTQRNLGRLGNYELVRTIGQGGFATVYLGRHIHLKSYAAVKVLKVTTEAELFKKEAQTIMDLAHPNIVRVLDFDVDQDDDTAFIVMDYAPYGSLLAQYKFGTIVPVDAVLSYVNQAAAALQYAHDHRIIHRDVKPSNLLVGKQRAIWLSDFGIALAAVSTRNTRTQDAMGTVAYMAPEQIKGKPRPASDQYALAVSVYEWLAGRRPFRGTLGEITAQHLSSVPPSLRTYNPDISPEVEAVVLQALAKEPLERFSRIEEFAAALEDAAGVRPRPAARESFTTEVMSPTGTRDTVILTAQQRDNDPRSSRSAPSMRTVRQGQSSRGLASVGTVREEEEQVAGRSRVSARQPNRRPPRLSRRSILIALGVVGVGGASSLVFAALHSGPQPSQTLVQPHPTATAGPQRPTAAAPTQQPTPTPTTAPQQPTPTPQPEPTPAQPLEPAGTTLVTYTGHSDLVFAVAWSPDGTRLASGGQDKTVQIWDTQGANLSTGSGHANSITFVSWSPDSTRVATASEDHTIRVWDVKSGNTLFTCQGHTDTIHSVAWSPHGTRLASGSVDKTVRLWDATNGNQVAIYQNHTTQVWDVAWSPDGTRVASASGDDKAAVKENTVKIWNVSTGETTITYTGHNGEVIYISWSPDGRFIASGSSDKTVQVWNVATATTQLTYRGHSNLVFGVAWSPNGMHVASASIDTTAQVWDPITGTTQLTYRGHSSVVFGVAWSPDGTRVASASQDKTVQVWQA